MTRQEVMQKVSDILDDLIAVECARCNYDVDADSDIIDWLEEWKAAKLAEIDRETRAMMN